MKPMNAISALARRLALAGNVTRLSVLCTLMRKRSACVSEIAEETHESIATVSHHLRILAGEGLVVPLREGKRVCYALSRDPFASDLKRLACKYAEAATRSEHYSITMK